MKFQLATNDESLLTTARWIFRSVTEIDLPAHTVWEILSDDRAWNEWHPEVTNIVWKDAATHQHSGRERTVLYKDPLVGSVQIYEVFDVWEEGVRFSMYFKELSLPTIVSYRSVREEFAVQAASDTKCIFTRTVAMQPGFLTRFAAGCVLYPQLKKLFTKTCPERMLKAVAEGRLPVK